MTQLDTSVDTTPTLASVKLCQTGQCQVTGAAKPIPQSSTSFGTSAITKRIIPNKGQVNGALGKLQHALHNFPCEGRLFVVVTGERDRRKIDALLHPFFAGAYHELSKHTIMLTPEEVSVIHEWVVAHQGVLKRLLGQ